MLNWEIAGCTFTETREGLGTWPRDHLHSESALKKMYAVVNFFISANFLFFFCSNFISIHYHAQKQKKNKNYLR